MQWYAVMSGLYHKPWIQDAVLNQLVFHGMSEGFDGRKWAPARFDCYSVVLLLELSFWGVQVSKVVVDVVLYLKEDIVVSSIVETMWGSLLFLKIWFLCGQFATKTKYHWHRDTPNKYPLYKVYIGLIMKGPSQGYYHFPYDIGIQSFLFWGTCCFFSSPLNLS